MYVYASFTVFFFIFASFPRRATSSQLSLQRSRSFKYYNNIIYTVSLADCEPNTTVPSVHTILYSTLRKHPVRLYGYAYTYILIFIITTWIRQQCTYLCAWVRLYYGTIIYCTYVRAHPFTFSAPAPDTGRQQETIITLIYFAVQKIRAFRHRHRICIGL